MGDNNNGKTAGAPVKEDDGWRIMLTIRLRKSNSFADTITLLTKPVSTT